ncbi:3-hydroxyacyl-ACP dehydratase FabZ family protein [Pseudomarimonas salicorniae]|uniref:Beta-hydroxyacyl-ACP dehydratase n=1 Tax=Pseudomarimonas salicorniae TaxID=2933270 RepID=A0ABT0GD55_9GAMM|nr:3-hydroxyacyl-ACP dehydratase FabZ family protein [Lysobacter sp. CAU 1642]MCK7592363.1 beta-hydroxyacyl-ACP dehydratase [Lysobacter sp. CAU 1642]
MSLPLQTLCVPPDHPCLAGHFPGNPVVPGVLLLEAVLDAAERIADWPAGGCRLPQVKFVRPLLPGQVAELQIERIDDSRLRFRISREGELLASGELGAAA